jgi:hypothetical protein
MGKDNRNLTPKLTGAQQAQVSAWAAQVKELVTRWAAESPERERQRRILDDYVAIRDGLKPPRWMKLNTSNAAPTPQSKPSRRLGWQERRLLPILCKYFPPDGRPAALTPQEIKNVRDDYAEQYNRQSVSTKTVRRAAGLLPRD